MRVHLGSDHAAFDLKNALINHLRGLGHEPVDAGPVSYDAEDDYPVYVLRAAEAVVADPGSCGVVLGGSGNGEAMAANKVVGIRAALVWNEDTARLAREHNDANVLSLGARQVTEGEAKRFVEIFVSTAFSNEPRHARRLAMVTGYETDGLLPPLP
ncbi:MAG: ribose-5-phosphate isomerase [Frankiales bacterium]|nr:ribose-5-phosphate isomerase [Frankiales bacterium]